MYHPGYLQVVHFAGCFMGGFDAQLNGRGSETSPLAYSQG